MGALSLGCGYLFDFNTIARMCGQPRQDTTPGPSEQVVEDDAKPLAELNAGDGLPALCGLAKSRLRRGFIVEYSAAGNHRMSQRGKQDDFGIQAKRGVMPARRDTFSQRRPLRRREPR
jgi:hypothetical protein